MGTPEKIARNNSIFRDANDQIDAAAEAHRLDRDRPAPFICECSDSRCMKIVRLTLEEYEHVRSDPRRFVHALGHEEEVPGSVTTLEKHDRFVVVEKTGHAGDVAARLGKEPEHGRERSS